MRVVILGKTFLTALKRLQKRYPHARDDLKLLIDELEQGSAPGDQIQGSGLFIKPDFRIATRNEAKAVATESFIT